MTVTTLGLATVALLVFGIWALYKALCGTFWLLGQLFRLLGWIILHIVRFVRNTLVDCLHFIGALLTAFVVIPLALINLLIFRLPQAAHYGRAVEDELVSALLCLYRVSLGHPLRFVGLGPILDGLEKRVPRVLEQAPAKRLRRGQERQFPGYKVTGTLRPGGSGAQLFTAQPETETIARCQAAGVPMPEKVVIKSFAIEAGSTLPQIVRESRALAAARNLGLVLEHRLGDDYFYYVMPFVDGDNLSSVVDRLHERAGPEGLKRREIELVVLYAQDLLLTLERFHHVGLWHKDVKPANLIVSDDRAHLVDLGLVTPIHSALTLTTHGTEYYRDPEMVRLALQGVKVHEVDGVKFDLYSAGAVLYSMVENSFPAHGSLSQITKRCPEALQWIIHRSMAEMSARYGSARQMLDDLAALAAHPDPDSMRPADLPSFGKRGAHQDPPAEGATAAAPHPAAPHPAARRARPQREPLDPELRRRRRRHGLAAAAAVIVGLVAIRGLASGVTALGHAGLPISVSTHESFDSGPSDREQPDREQLDREQFDQEEWATLRLAQAIASEHVGEWKDEIGRLFPEQRESERPGDTRGSHDHGIASGASGGGEPLGRVLILEDLPGPGSAEVVGELEETLQEGGFEVVGSGRRGSESDRDEETEIALVAEARVSVALGDPSDPEAIRRLQGFLDEREDLYAIFWLAPGEGEDGHRCRVLVRREIPLGEITLSSNRN
jgi:serine/threonine protein kinase